MKEKPPTPLALAKSAGYLVHKNRRARGDPLLDHWWSHCANIAAPYIVLYERQMYAELEIDMLTTCRARGQCYIPDYLVERIHGLWRRYYVRNPPLIGRAPGRWFPT